MFQIVIAFCLVFNSSISFVLFQKLDFKPIQPESSTKQLSEPVVVPSQVNQVRIDISANGAKGTSSSDDSEPAVVPKEVKQVKFELSFMDGGEMDPNNNPDDENTDDLKGDDLLKYWKSKVTSSQVTTKGDPKQTDLDKVDKKKKPSSGKDTAIALSWKPAEDGQFGRDYKRGKNDKPDRFAQISLPDMSFLDQDEPQRKELTDFEKQRKLGRPVYEGRVRKGPTKIATTRPWARKLENLEANPGSMSPEKEPEAKSQVTVDEKPKGSPQRVNVGKVSPRPDVKSFKTSFYQYGSQKSPLDSSGETKSIADGPRMKPGGTYDSQTKPSDSQSKPFGLSVTKTKPLYSYRTAPDGASSRGSPLSSNLQDTSSSRQSLNLAPLQLSRPVTPIEETQAYAALSKGPTSPLKTPEVIMHRVSDMLKDHGSKQKPFRFYGEIPVSTNIRFIGFD